MFYITDILWDGIVQEIQKSPYLSLQIDESSPDVSYYPHLVLCVQFELEDQTDHTIFYTSWNFLTIFGFHKKVVAIAIDGAPIMQRIPDIVTNYCPVHRLALVMKNFQKPEKLKKKIKLLMI